MGSQVGGLSIFVSDEAYNDIEGLKKCGEDLRNLQSQQYFLDEDMPASKRFMEVAKDLDALLKRFGLLIGRDYEDIIKKIDLLRLRDDQ